MESEPASLFDWGAYLDLADELAARADEAAARTAINRSYYVVFHSARDYLNAKGPPVPDEGRAHQVLWNRIRNISGATPKLIASEGKRLRTMRNSADYEARYAKDDVFREADDALRTARQLLALLTSLPPP